VPADALPEVGRAAGLIVLLVGPILVRVYVELLMVVFSINSTLREIRDNTAKAKQVAKR